ncbi:hypothetical protein [Catenuloplanes atrovinosus]|uniref:Uncharacterized protein n=1 Tax=Catenuloplanes atrovinosus TaxID=137266 RepID=A0AAE4CBK1_9ACTN|nr:hypothetical protein [Catenuloplanes atrovinosus]MDR7277004.1 hypothetical protein [Catenuloplanes atrovinosus]
MDLIQGVGAASCVSAKQVSLTSQDSSDAVCRSDSPFNVDRQFSESTVQLTTSVASNHAGAELLGKLI